jgi:hypothetical protein
MLAMDAESAGNKGMMPMRGLLFVLAIVCHCWNTQAASQVILFGGGPNPNDSQVSIELNTVWISRIIRQHEPQRIVQTLYTDGNDAGVDVHGWEPIDHQTGISQPLARVFGQHRKNGYVYTSSRIANNVLPADSGTLSSTLEGVFAAAGPGDELLLIYQGHGGYNPSDTNKNYLRLWGNTRLTVTELESLISTASPEATVRFVFPQCFSGSFTRLVYREANADNGLADGVRCGFLAQRDDRESEGCTDGVNTGDYRDYASYFFSALDGKTIDGDSLLQNPDWNNDGHVTLGEAHLYTLANAYSVDFSHSTSEDYLGNWQPWYLRWAPVPQNPDNIYNRVAQRIAARFDIKEQGAALVGKVAARLVVLKESVRTLEQEREQLEKAIRKAQRQIQGRLAMKWPSLEAPYTVHFRKTMQEDLNEVQKYISGDHSYPRLVENQDRLPEIDKELLDAQRELAQMEKILRMRNLARTLAQFQLYADDSNKVEYERLVQCENSGL